MRISASANRGFPQVAAMPNATPACGYSELPKTFPRNLVWSALQKLGWKYMSRSLGGGLTKEVYVNPRAETVDRNQWLEGTHFFNSIHETICYLKEEGGDHFIEGIDRDLDKWLKEAPVKSLPIAEEVSVYSCLSLKLANFWL